MPLVTHDLLASCFSSAHWGWVQPGQSQTNPNPDWLAGVLGSAGFNPRSTNLLGWKNRELNAHFHATQPSTRANALTLLTFSKHFMQISDVKLHATRMENNLQSVVDSTSLVTCQQDETSSSLPCMWYDHSLLQIPKNSADQNNKVAAQSACPWARNLSSSFFLSCPE